MPLNKETKPNKLLVFERNTWNSIKLSKHIINIAK